jgi:hypothetical protein
MADQSKTFTVPQAVRKEAKRGLDLRKEHGRGGLDSRQAKKEGVGSGVQRASNLVQGKVSYGTVKRMLAFFRRHEKYKKDGHHDDRSSATSRGCFGEVMPVTRGLAVSSVKKRV